MGAARSYSSVDISTLQVLAHAESHANRSGALYGNVLIELFELSNCTQIWISRQICTFWSGDSNV